MKESERADYVQYRLEKALQTMAAAELLASHEMWNAVVNRLYYACFYAVTALLVKTGIETKSHTGVKTQFFLHFVKTGQVSIPEGKLFGDLFDWRPVSAPFLPRPVLLDGWSKRDFIDYRAHAEVGAGLHAECAKKQRFAKFFFKPSRYVAPLHNLA